MKSKRQTIWLVSMLSLMVILSAYYLFTEDGPSPSAPVDGQQVADSGVLPSNEDQTLGNDVILSEVTTDGSSENGNAITDEDAAILPEGQEEGAEDSAVTKEETTSTEKTPTTGTAKADTSSTKSAAPNVTDQDVLSEVEAQGVSSMDTLTAYQFERTQENMKKQEELMQTISDTDKPVSESAMAQQQLNALEEKEAKIYDIEEKLKQQYANAVVTEADDKFKVVVVSEKMEAKEAVGIMDLIIKELDITQDKVSVQYVTQ
ncbi:SpoIIIAH-like family protein [Paenibacillus sanguinis]|uniref:SpoIIIAH-like family protein n=1 Tax=Paenibacillus sanguinis TaxID=225906 RepID=UPI0003809E88|nr:SpoIIIAH-like family protein [Paenibacillus sanguinis]